MKITKVLHNSVNGIAFTAIFILLILTGLLMIGMTRLNSKISAMDTKVTDMKEALDCPQVYNDGENGEQYCISVNDELNNITDTLGKVQDTVNNICTPNTIGC